VDAASTRISWLVGLAIAALTLAVYAQVTRFDFVRFDDARYVTENDMVREGLSGPGFVWALTTFHKSNWHPLSWLSHMADVELYGLEPAGHHATNVLLHLANALILLGLLRRLTGRLWSSAWVAAMFAVHPLHVESVAWVAERKDVLSTCFGLLAIQAWLGFARSGSLRAYAISALLFAASLASKPMLVTLPFLLLLLDYWPLDRLRNDRTLLLRIGEKLPLLALSAASSAVTIAAQRHGGALGWFDFDLGQRAANAIMSYATYIAKAVWPVNLAVFYPHPYGPGGEPWPAAQIALAGTVLAAFTVAVLASGRRPAVVGWLWFVGTLVPVSGVIQAGLQGMADRYTYVPLIGLFVLVACSVQKLLERTDSPSLRIATGAAGVVSVLACAVVAWGQAVHWRDSTSLYEHTLSVAPSAVIHNNLGTVHGRAGRVDASIHHYRAALAIDPGHRMARRNLAYKLRERGEYVEAARHWLRSRDIGTDSATGLATLGAALQAQGEVDRAVEHFRRALEVDSDSEIARRGLEQSLSARGQDD
jgi:tetratricopeptide (TPR) repeat protein